VFGDRRQEELYTLQRYMVCRVSAGYCNRTSLQLLDKARLIRCALNPLQAYEANGLDSSYLFRVDEEWVIDATVKVRTLHCTTYFVNYGCDHECVSI